MDQNIIWVLVAAGTLLLLAAAIGGGFDLKGIKVPVISRSARILSFLVGPFLIAGGLLLGRMPRENSNPSERTTPKTDQVAVPSLVGLSQEAALDSIESLKLKAGRIDHRPGWAPSGEVLSQQPLPDTLVPVETEIDLAVVDADVLFRSERVVTPRDGEKLTATADYRVRLIRAPDSGRIIGEFVLMKADVAPRDPGLDEVMNRLLNAPGHVPIEGMDDLDLTLTWEAFGAASRDLGQAMAEANLDPSKGMGSLGPSLWLSIVGVQVAFDLRSIFTTVSADRTPATTSVSLQRGTKLLSTIRVEPSSTLAGDGTNLFASVMRREAGGDSFVKVGDAAYRAHDGLLSWLDVRFDLPSNGGVFRLKIQRLD